MKEKSESLYGDPEGPGCTLQVKTEPKNVGARISHNSKKFVGFIFVVVVLLVFTGIALTGHQKKSGDDKNGGTGASSKEQVGMAAPPSPPPKPGNPVNPYVPGGTSPAPAPAASSPPGLTLGNALNNPNAPGLNRGQQAPLSEKQKYRQWLISQHYKDLEGKVLSAQSAQESGFGEQNVGLQQVTGSGQGAVGASVYDPLAVIRAAQAVATPGVYGQQIDSGLLAQLKGEGQGANSQDQNKSFLADQKKGNDGYLHAGVEEALGKHELLAGSIIPAVLITAIDSELPGVVTAMVRQTIYDTLHPDQVVIPQGAKLIGQYSSNVAYGQSRALIAWNRIIFPNGSMLDLQGMLGTDGKGQSGFADQVDNHYMKIFGSSILISLLGAGAQLSQPQNAGAFNTPTASQQATAALAQGLDNTGTQLLQKNLGIQPTIKIRAGYLFNVMVNRTMILPVYPIQQ